MIYINGQKMDSALIPTMKKRVVFELTSLYSRDNLDTDTGINRKSKAGYLSIPSSYVVFDKERNENIEIRYVKTDNPHTDSAGKEVRRLMPHKVHFYGGVKVCQLTDSDLLYWFKRHPDLERGEAGGARFKMLDAALDASEKNIKMLKEHTALSLLIGDTSKPIYEQRNFLKSMSLGVNVDALTDDEVTEALTVEAKKNPGAFIAKFNSSEVDIRSMIHDAEKSDFIKITSDGSKWVWGGKTKLSAGNMITAIPSGRNPLDFFMEWIMRTDNSGVFNEIQVLTKRINAPKEAKKQEEDTMKSLIDEAKELGMNISGLAKLNEAELKKKITRFKKESV